MKRLHGLLVMVALVAGVCGDAIRPGNLGSDIQQQTADLDAMKRLHRQRVGVAAIPGSTASRFASMAMHRAQPEDDGDSEESDSAPGIGRNTEDTGAAQKHRDGDGEGQADEPEEEALDESDTDAADAETDEATVDESEDEAEEHARDNSEDDEGVATQASTDSEDTEEEDHASSELADDPAEPEEADGDRASVTDNRHDKKRRPRHNQRNRDGSANSSTSHRSSQTGTNSSEAVSLDSGSNASSPETVPSDPLELVESEHAEAQDKIKALIDARLEGWAAKVKARDSVATVAMGKLAAARDRIAALKQAIDESMLAAKEASGAAANAASGEEPGESGAGVLGSLAEANNRSATASRLQQQLTQVKANISVLETAANSAVNASKSTRVAALKACGKALRAATARLAEAGEKLAAAEEDASEELRKAHAAAVAAEEAELNQTSSEEVQQRIDAAAAQARAAAAMQSLVKGERHHAALVRSLAAHLNTTYKAWKQRLTNPVSLVAGMELTMPAEAEEEAASLGLDQRVLDELDSLAEPDTALSKIRAAAVLTSGEADQLKEAAEQMAAEEESAAELDEAKTGVKPAGKQAAEAAEAEQQKEAAEEAEEAAEAEAIVEGPSSPSDVEINAGQALAPGTGEGEQGLLFSAPSNPEVPSRASGVAADRSAVAADDALSLAETALEKAAGAVSYPGKLTTTDVKVKVDFSGGADRGVSGHGAPVVSVSKSPAFLQRGASSNDNTDDGAASAIAAARSAVASEAAAAEAAKIAGEAYGNLGSLVGARVGSKLAARVARSAAAEAIRRHGAGRKASTLQSALEPAAEAPAAEAPAAEAPAAEAPAAEAPAAEAPAAEAPAAEAPAAEAPAAEAPAAEAPAASTDALTSASGENQVDAADDSGPSPTAMQAEAEAKAALVADAASEEGVLPATTEAAFANSSVMPGNSSSTGNKTTAKKPLPAPGSDSDLAAIVGATDDGAALASTGMEAAQEAAQEAEEKADHDAAEAENGAAVEAAAAAASKEEAQMAAAKKVEEIKRAPSSNDDEPADRESSEAQQASTEEKKSSRDEPQADVEEEGPKAKPHVEGEGGEGDVKGKAEDITDDEGSEQQDEVQDARQEAAQAQEEAKAAIESAQKDDADASDTEPSAAAEENSEDEASKNLEEEKHAEEMAEAKIATAKAEAIKAQADAAKAAAQAEKEKAKQAAVQSQLDEIAKTKAEAEEAKEKAEVIAEEAKQARDAATDSTASLMQVLAGHGGARFLRGRREPDVGSQQNVQAVDDTTEAEDGYMPAKIVAQLPVQPTPGPTGAQSADTTDFRRPMIVDELPQVEEAPSPAPAPAHGHEHHKSAVTESHGNKDGSMTIRVEHESSTAIPEAVEPAPASPQSQQGRLALTLEPEPAKEESHD